MKYIVYKRNVCKIKEIKNINGEDYYVLTPIDDESLIITVPKNSSSNLIREIISKEETEKLIDSIPSINIIDTNEKILENEYKTLLNSGKLSDLIKIIKTTYLRNFNRINNHKKISEKDDNYFNKAENLLCHELSISLGLSFDETKKYIKERVESLIN